ncbi:MAG: glutaminyl-peptide cyclotransferase, partial [Thermoanaerobaculia bacterium]
MRILAAALIASAAASACGSSTPPATSTPATSEIRLELEVVATYPHDPAAFTQGLVWSHGKLFESTGMYGRSSLREVELESGRVLKRIDLDAAQ